MNDSFHGKIIPNTLLLFGGVNIFTRNEKKCCMLDVCYNGSQNVSVNLI